MAAQLTRTKGPVSPRAAFVNRARDKFLARSCFAGQEHGGIGGCDRFDFLQHLPQRGTVSHDAAEAVVDPELVLEVQLLGHQPVGEPSDFLEREAVL